MYWMSVDGLNGDLGGYYGDDYEGREPSHSRRSWTDYYSDLPLEATLKEYSPKAYKVFLPEGLTFFFPKSLVREEGDKTRVHKKIFLQNYQRAKNGN